LVPEIAVFKSFQCREDSALYDEIKLVTDVDRDGAALEGFTRERRRFDGRRKTLLRNVLPCRMNNEYIVAE
jgi:hypothetical protein